jgi:hypothetical protein
MFTTRLTVALRRGTLKFIVPLLIGGVVLAAAPRL